MARNCIKEPRYVPPVQSIGEQPDLFGGPTVQHHVERRNPPPGWQRQMQKWGRCTTMADLDPLEPMPPAPQPEPSPVFLVACAAMKLDHAAPARDLYVSPWFQKARAYVERQAGAWFILSAKHGLVAPDLILEPYDEALTSMRAGARRLWGARVAEAIAAQIAPDAPLIVLAGRAYREPLWPTIQNRASVPMEGLGIGDQLVWLAAH